MTRRSPIFRNSDASRRGLERAVAVEPGDVNAMARLLQARLRDGSVLEGNVRAAAYMGVPEAISVVGISGLTPQARHDELLPLLSRSDQAYAVLWAWACLNASVSDMARLGVSATRHPLVSRADAGVASWLEDPMSEGTVQCRHVAFLAAAEVVEERGRGRRDLLCSMAAYTALAVSPNESDFPGFDTGNLGEDFPIRFLGDFPILLPTRSARVMRSTDDEVMFEVVEANMPLLSSPPNGEGFSAVSAVVDVMRASSNWATARVSLTAAAAALARLEFVEWSFSVLRRGRSIGEVMLGVEAATAGRIRDRLLAAPARGPFRYGRFGT